MIEEIDTVSKYDFWCENWLQPEDSNHKSFWNSNARIGLGNYDSEMSSIFFRAMIEESGEAEEAGHSFMKIWSYKLKEKYISSACFFCERHPMTGKKILSEVFWMACGKIAETYIEKMSLIKLLQHVEKYGRENDVDYIRAGKVIGVHTQNLDKFYVKSGYKPNLIVYSKDLKENA